MQNLESRRCILENWKTQPTSQMLTELIICNDFCMCMLNMLIDSCVINILAQYENVSLTS